MYDQLKPFYVWCLQLYRMNGPRMQRCRQCRSKSIAEYEEINCKIKKLLSEITQLKILLARKKYPQLQFHPSFV